MNKKQIFGTILLSLVLLINTVLAHDVNVTVDVVLHPPSSPKGLEYTMKLMGDGIGSFFRGVGLPLTVFLILLSISMAFGVILKGLLERGGMGESKFSKYLNIYNFKI